MSHNLEITSLTQLTHLLMEEILYETGVNHGLKLPTSSGERWISEPSTASSEVQFVVRHQSLLALCAGLVGFALGGSFALQAVSRQKGSLQIFADFCLYTVLCSPRNLEQDESNNDQYFSDGLLQPLLYSLYIYINLTVF